MALLPALLFVALAGLVAGKEEQTCRANPGGCLQRDHVMLQMPTSKGATELKSSEMDIAEGEALLVEEEAAAHVKAELVSDAEEEQQSTFCCFAFSDSSNPCGSCYPNAATSSGYCGANQGQCVACNSAAKWCTAGASPSPSPTTTRAATSTSTTQRVASSSTTARSATTATTSNAATTRPASTTRSTKPTTTPTTSPPAPTQPATTSAPKPSTWIRGTWTTGYWDCCKPSCSWPNKGNVNRPAAACDAATGQKLTDVYEPSVCKGGKAASCKENQPRAIKPSLSMGFAAAAVSGNHGLTGDDNCGQCFELKFVSTVHPDGYWGGSHANLTGKTMIVQVNNIGYDVTGDHSFDIQIPAAGQGAFTSGCVLQYPGKQVQDFDCNNHYGGCYTVYGCGQLPEELQPGCVWRYEWYHWLQTDGKTNNPYVDFRRVKCPTYLTDISGSIPVDDDNFPEINMADYP